MILGSRGYTIIEILVVLVLFSILLTMIFSITTFSIKTLNMIDKDIELQQQAQFIFNFMEKKIIESMGVIYLDDRQGNKKHNTNDKVVLNNIIFKNPPDCEFPGYIFTLDTEPEYDYYNLKYGNGDRGIGTVEVGNYIDSMEVEPIPEDKTYCEADGIVLRINFILAGHAFTCENSFYFRNSVEVPDNAEDS